MLIHSFFTDGFYEFGKVFVKSFKKIHGTEFPMILSTYNLSKNKVEELYSIYSNLKVWNKEIDFEKIAETMNTSIDEVKKYKYKIEHVGPKPLGPDLYWKLYISMNKRYKISIPEVMNHNHGEKYMIHLDADSYIRKNLNPVFDIIRKNDISLIFRLKNSKIQYKILGALLGFTINDNSKLFMEKWISYMDNIPLMERPVDYGQTSCYYAYKDLKESDIKIGNIDNEWIRNDLDQKALIWSGNCNRGKDKTCNLFKKDFK